MKRNFVRLLTVLILFLLLAFGTFAVGQNLPVIKGKKVVAIVNDEQITLDEFNREVKSWNEGKAEGRLDKAKEEELLKRLINSKLMIQEARKIGLDQLSEIKNMVDVYSRVTLREELIERQIRNVKADDKVIDEIYKKLIQEWKIRSVIFEKEDDAKKMEEEIKAGNVFGDLAKKAVADGTAKGGQEGVYVGQKDLLPEIAEAVSKMKVGAISPITPVKSGFVIFELEDVSYPENPEAKERARREALYRKQEQVFKEYNDALVKKYVKINLKVLDRLDFESEKPGFENLLKDGRVIAEIKGEKPITVGDLATQIRQQFFHGVQRAIESKSVNEKKIPVLQEMLHKRVFRKEALRLGLDKSEVYKDKIREYKNSLIFGTFVQKAIVPDVKPKEEELKAYYNEHIKDYTYSEMMKINSLVFGKREFAEKALENLRKGTDFQWLADNAEGQVDKSKDVLNFEAEFLNIKDLPEGIRKSVSGAKPGDFRLYESPKGYFYVLAIRDVIPARPQSFEEAKKIIAKVVFDDKLNKAVEDWAEKLRAVSDVKVYLTDRK
jgi:parvulin-like peptidyl-prolyl isomerase